MSTNKNDANKAAVLRALDAPSHGAEERAGEPRCCPCLGPMWAFRTGYFSIPRRRTAFCSIYAAPDGAKQRYCLYRGCPLRDTQSEICTRGGRIPALMERVVPGSRQRADLVGTAVFWAAIGVTLCTAIPFALFPAMRAWLACAVLLMWTCFFTANAVRSRRTHSIDLGAGVFARCGRAGWTERRGCSKWKSGWCGCSALASLPRTSRSGSSGATCRSAGSIARPPTGCLSRYR